MRVFSKLLHIPKLETDSSSPRRILGERVFHLLLKALALISLPLAVALLVLWREHNEIHYLGESLLLYLMLVYFAFMPRMDRRLRLAGGMTLIWVASAISVGVQLPNCNGTAWQLFFSLIMTAFGGSMLGLGSVAVNVLTVLLLPHLLRILHPGMPRMGCEFLHVVEFLLLNLLAVVSLGLLLRWLAQSLQGERDLSARLRSANLRLGEEIERARRAHEEQALSELRYRQLVEYAPLAILAVDDRGCVQEFNERFREIAGKEANVARGVHISELAKYWSQESRDDMQRCLKEGKSLANQTLVELSGEERLLRYHIAPWPMGEGRYGMLSVVEDVSDRRNLERQLLHAQKMEAIGILAGGIAHDFNNILGAILGYVEMLLIESDMDSRTGERLTNIQRGALRARDLVSQILSFSRKRGQETRLVAVDSMVREVLKLLRATLPATIEIRQEIENDLQVQADPAQLHQVLMNLCTNGHHAMAESGGVLSIHARRIEAEDELLLKQTRLSGPCLLLSVADTGCGMTAEVRDQIFLPFFTTKAEGLGTGMGLAVVHGIVRAHGGEISVESEPGKGTCFHILLPLARKDEAPAPPAENAASRVTRNLPLGTERILLVDDERDLVELGEVFLGELGYTVTGVQLPQEALRLLEADPQAYDLLISDMTMPGMRGDRMALEMRKLRPDLPIIICTGYSEDMNPEKARRLNLQGFLMKPLELRELAVTVRRVLDS